MENKINQAVRGTQEPSVFRRRWGWKSSNFSQLPVEGEIFSLTFPFIEQPLGLAQFQDRVALSPPENRATKMENKINQAVRGTQEPSVFRRRWGWKSSNFSQLPVEGEIFSLTFPFIEQAI